MFVMTNPVLTNRLTCSVADANIGAKTTRNVFANHSRQFRYNHPLYGRRYYESLLALAPSVDGASCSPNEA